MQNELTALLGQTKEQKLLWEMYRGWTFHSAEYATAQDVKDMFQFFEQVFGILVKPIPEDLMPNSILQLLTVLLKPKMVFRIHHENSEGRTHKDYFDFLFILPPSNQTQFSEYELLIELVTSNAANTGCSVVKDEFLQRSLKDGYPYLVWACSANNLIYEDGKGEVPSVSHELSAAMVNRAGSEFRLGHHRAKSFLTSATAHLEIDDLAMAMFNIRQAIEITFRAMIGSLIGIDKSAHNLRILKKHLRKVAPQLTFLLPDNTDKEIQLMDLLERAHHDTRFKPDYEVDRKDVKTLLRRAITIHKDSEKVFNKQIQFYQNYPAEEAKKA